MGGGGGSGGGNGGMGGNGPGDGGGGPGGMDGMGDHRPPYEGMLMNGRLPSNAPAFDVADGERVRFRFINGGGATTFPSDWRATSSRSRTPTVGLSNRSTSIPSTWGPGSATTQ